MDRDDREEGPRKQHDPRAAQVDRVLAERPPDDRVAALHLDVGETEQLAGLAKKRRAHLDRRGRRLRRHAAAVRDADDEVEVAHRLAEQRRRHRVEGELLPFPFAREHDLLERQSLEIRRRVEGFVEAEPRGQPRFVEGAAHPLVGTRHPAAAAEQRERLLRVHLMAGVATRALGAALGVGDRVQLAEELLERLDALGEEALALPGRPVAALEQVHRVRQA